MSSRHRSLSSVSSPSRLSRDSRKNPKLSRRNHHPISPSRKREVELWRRDQRAAAKELSHAYLDENPPEITESIASTITPKSLRVSATSTPTLPSTSHAFNLYPQSKRRRRSSPRPNSSYNPAYITSYDSIYPPAHLDQLRSHAFWELQRSVAETGEGFVRKMRDWEDVQELRGRKRPQSVMLRKKSDMAGSNEEEDVMIYSEESQGSDDAQTWGPPRKKRALSAGTMEFETLSADVEDSERCSSPVDHWDSVPSGFGSDDDNDSLNPGSTTSITTNPSSSPMSWSFSSDAQTDPWLHPTHSLNMPRSSRELSLPSPASRSDKALAALTLALANGAGGLNDYGALLNVPDDSSLTGGYQVGELWN